MIPINFVTSDFLRWGNGLQRLLDAPEVDRNFWELKVAIEDVIANPPSPVQIVSFQISGIGMTITMSSGSVIGPLPLPVLAWRWRDDWLPLVPYAALDVFKIDGVGIFLVLKDHTSAATFDPAATSGGDPLYRQLFSIITLFPSRAIGISAAGTTQAGATPLTADWNIVSTVTAGQGVMLRSGTGAGGPQWVFNSGANALLVYPQDGDSAKINAQATDGPFTIEPNSGTEFRDVSLTQWYSTQ